MAWVKVKEKNQQKAIPVNITITAKTHISEIEATLKSTLNKQKLKIESIQVDNSGIEELQQPQKIVGPNDTLGALAARVYKKCDSMGLKLKTVDAKVPSEKDYLENGNKSMNETLETAKRTSLIMIVFNVDCTK